ncbi:MAG TPA: hypothetical protein VIJ17_14795, partial [Pseudolabrys sp.]
MKSRRERRRDLRRFQSLPTGRLVAAAPRPDDHIAVGQAGAHAHDAAIGMMAPPVTVVIAIHMPHDDAIVTIAHHALSGCRKNSQHSRPDDSAHNKQSHL